MEKIIAFQWVIDKDGRGVLYSFVDRRSVLIRTENTFDSVAELPEWMSEAIREAGGPTGEWVSSESEHHSWGGGY